MADDLEKGLGNSNQKKVSVKLSDMKPGRPSLGSERRGSRKPDDPSSSSSRRRSSRSSSPPIVDSARPSLSVFRFKQALSNSGTGQTGTSTPSRGGSDFRPTNSSPSATPSAEGQIGSTASAASPNRGIQLLLKAASTSTTEFLAKRRQTESASTSTPESKRRRPSALGAVPPPPPPPGRRPGVGTEDGGSVVLSWTNLKVTSRDGKKILLDNLNGQVHAGFTAIMGPSGSGKSTLLNTLACRMEKSASVSGQIRLNGKEYTSTDLKKMSGYVMQDDLLNAHLTVEETLLYTVKLKLEPTYTEAQLLERVDLDEGAEYPLQLNRERMPWHRQYLVLLNRGLKEQVRRKNVVITQVVQSIVTAILIGGVFFQIGDGQKSAVRRQPVLFFCVINQGVFGALTVINSFPSERVLILRERAAGMYYSSAYYVAKITAELTFQVLSPIVFSCVVYWMVGFQNKARKFFLFMFFMILCQLSATSLALMTSAICRTTDLSVTVLPMLLEINRLFGGFFLAPASLPKYFVWLDALSYVKYCYIAISQNELHDLKLTCKASELDSKGKCPIQSGSQSIKTLGLDYITIAECAAILILYIIATRFFAYLGIRYIKH